MTLTQERTDVGQRSRDCAGLDGCRGTEQRFNCRKPRSSCSTRGPGRQRVLSARPKGATSRWRFLGSSRSQWAARRAPSRQPDRMMPIDFIEGE